MFATLDLRGINNLDAGLYWYASNRDFSKPDKKRGIQVHEHWFVKIQHTLNDSSHYVKASPLAVIRYRLYRAHYQQITAWWAGMTRGERNDVLKTTAAIIGAFASVVKFLS